MSPHVARVRILLQQRRYDLALETLQRALAEDPDDGMAHAWLGLVHLEQKQPDRAQKSLREAIRLDPELAFPHHLMGQLLLHEERFTEAIEPASAALKIEPENPAHYGLRCQIELGRKRWAEALDWAERGLTMDAQDANLANLRGFALTQLGRREEAGDAIGDALRTEPDNPDSHANQGWRLLHAGKPKAALEHFREALRLEPGHEWAKSGLVEALKARYWPYRVVLGYFLWMGRLSGRAQMTILLGGYALYQVLRVAADNNEAVRPYVTPVIVAYLAFVVLTWVGQPLFDFIVRLNPYGRNALNRFQRRASNALMLGLLGASACGVAWWLSEADYPRSQFAFGALCCFLLGIGFSRALAESSERRCRVLLGIVLAVAASMSLVFVGDAIGAAAIGILGAVGMALGVLAFVFAPFALAAR